MVKSTKKQSQLQMIIKVDAFISLKDHKDNFLSNPKCRLTNPAKIHQFTNGKIPMLLSIGLKMFRAKENVYSCSLI